MADHSTGKFPVIQGSEVQRGFLFWVVFLVYVTRHPLTWTLDALDPLCVVSRDLRCYLMKDISCRMVL